MAVSKEFANVRMLLIDNYDSFTYNLVQAFAAQGADVMVYRNDTISVEDALAIKPTHLVISPGPGRPEDAGVSLDMIAAFKDIVPMSPPTRAAVRWPSGLGGDSGCSTSVAEAACCENR